MTAEKEKQQPDNAHRHGHEQHHHALGHRFRPQPEINRSFWRKIRSTFSGLAGGTWLAAIVVLVLAVLFLSFVHLPPQLADQPGLSPMERAEVEGGVRTSLLQAVGGAALLIGLYFTARSAVLARQGQESDRFSKTVEQLGSESIDVRIGALYALENIAHDSRRFRPAVLEVLQRYIKGRGPGVDGEAPADTQVAVTVLARRKGRHRERDRIDLYETMLAGVRASNAHFQDLNAYHSNLSNGGFIRSDLRRAGFGWANLKGSFFSRSDLRHASFFAANLEGAFLPGVNARHAIFRSANLRRADFSHRLGRDGKIRTSAADLMHADFRDALTEGANFCGVDLRETHGLTQRQIDVAEINGRTILPTHLRRPDSVQPG